MARGRQENVRHLVIKCKASATFIDLARPVGFWLHMQVLPKDLYNALIDRGLDCWSPGTEGGDGSRGWLLALLLRSRALGPEVRNRQLGRNLRQVPPGTRTWATELAQSMLHEHWSEGADLFARTEQGALLLSEAAAGGAWAVVERLAEAGAGVNARDTQGGTPLHSAVAGSQRNLVLQLLAVRADVTATAERRAVEPAALAAAPVPTGSAGSGSSTVEGSTPAPVTALSLAEKAGWEEGAALLKEAIAREAAGSGDGTIDNVGIRLSGTFQCPECRQRFDTERAKEIHCRFTHDPLRPQEED